MKPNKGLKRIEIYKPNLNDLWFRKELLSDPETMSYNHSYGGTVSFLEEQWTPWYDYWLIKHENKRFYRYITDENTKKFVGEIAYHLDEKQNIYLANVIIHAKHRGKGYGRQGLLLLSDIAKKNGIDYLYDNIAIDNPAVKLFVENGFIEEYRTDKIIMLKKALD
ncbi:MAG: GNAT family N-acetyltransferase [Candidatus Riflebacteria bacterium]|nr:GNAT family N-acetyltransferase [Candidatus Riflebacteria bacterium]